MRRAGASLRCGARASHCGGFSCCRARALGAQASVVVARGLSSCGSRALEHRLSSCGAQALVAPRHVGSSRTRAQTHVPCIGRLILNHFATREVPTQVAFNSMCINGLHKNLSLLVKRTCMEWETVFTPDLVNLANKLAHIIEGDSRKKTTKILNLQHQRIETPKQIHPTGLCHYYKKT